jgi:hypothetical protein
VFRSVLETMDVVTVAIVGLSMALGGAGLIVAVCGAIYLAIKRQATIVVATLLLVVLLCVFAFWATQAANAIPANREPPRVGSDFGSMICNPSESSPSILVRGGLRLGGHDKVGIAGDMEMVGGLW